MSQQERGRVYFVKADWDPEARVWYVAKTDVPGLVAEADSPEELLSLLKTLVPEMVDLNGNGSGADIPYSVMLDHLTAERAMA